MKLFKLLEILFLALLWGPSYLYIKIAVEEISPLTMVTCRILMGTIILFGIKTFLKAKFPRDLKTWFHLSVMGIIAAAFPFTCFAVGEKYIDSSLASIINGLTPLATFMLAHFFLDDEKLNMQKIGGLALGVVGFFSLLIPSLKNLSFNGNLLGILMITSASISYGFAMVYGKKFLKGKKGIAIVTGQMLTTVPYLILLSFVFETPQQVLNISFNAFIALSMLAVFGTGFSFLLYYKILEHSGASALSMVTYLMQIIGILLGVFVRNETLSLNSYIAFTLILAGVMIVNRSKETKTKLQQAI